MPTQQQATTYHFSDQTEHVLVTGATGFVGQILVRALLANRQRVTILTRNPAKAQQLFGSSVQCIHTMQELPNSVQLDVIINLAGARILGWRWTKARKNILRQSRIGLTKGLIDWIARADIKPRQFFSASAIGYYGIQAQGDQRVLTEQAASQTIFMSELCQEWEQQAQQASQFGVQVICMRFGLVLGKQGALPMMLLPIKLGLGGALGTGQQWFSWIHVEDILRGIAFLWSNQPKQENEPNKQPNSLSVNFCAPEAVSQLTFSKTAAGLLARPCFMPTPALPLRIMLGEQADLLLEGQRVTPAYLQAQGFEFSYPDLRSALSALI